MSKHQELKWPTLIKGGDLGMKAILIHQICYRIVGKFGNDLIDDLDALSPLIIPNRLCDT